MSRRLEDLADHFRPLAEKLVAYCINERVQVMIIDTLRTPEEQEENIRKGVSWTRNSKHLTGEAIDIAPLNVLGLKNWAPNHEDWTTIGKVGEDLGLVWGGRWEGHKDCCHFEFALPSPKEITDD